MAEAGSGLSRALIVGYGNELRQDDGLGPVVAESLRDVLHPGGVTVEVLALPQLDTLLVPRLAEVDVAVFVDARRDDDDRRVIVTELCASDQPLQPAFTSHTLGVGQLLRVAREWYGSAPRCYLVAPKGYEFGIGYELSDAAQEAAGQARFEIERLLVREHRSHRSGVAE